MTWRLIITPKVQEALRTFAPQTKRSLRMAFKELTRDPWLGKPLRDELTGCHSFRVRRFRVVYQLRRERKTIAVIGVGPRETIYDEVVQELSQPS